MVLRFRARPAHSLFLGLCSVFKVQCLAILAFVLLPYRVDLYIIPCDLHYVNTFFVTFLTFFREALGFVEKEACLIIAFIGIKNSSKNLKKSAFFTCFFSKNRRKSAKFFFVSQIFFLKSCRFFLLSSLSASCRFNTYPSGAYFYILSFKINTLSFQ